MLFNDSKSTQKTMKKIITLFILSLLLLPIKAQNFIEDKTNIINISGGAVAWGDYDNNGDIDLFVSGNDSLYQIYSKIYRNENGNFTDIHANLIGAVYGAMADWGDFDSDGDLDLLVSGADNSMTGQTRIYRNDNGVFTDIGANLIGLRDLCSAKWGDYNGDGKLDILLSGFCDDSAIYLTKIYKNVNDSFYETNIQLIEAGSHKTNGFIDIDGDGDLDIFLAGRISTFASIYINHNGDFTNLTTDIENTNDLGSSDWADFDNDGDLDIAIMGITVKSPSHFITKIYRNDNNKFVDIGANLLGLGEGVIKWVDFDMDGDLDIFQSGMDFKGNLRCYLNRNDGGKFTFVPTNIKGVHWSTATFGDYNYDNATDFIINGFDSIGKPFTKLYKNNINKKLIASEKFICGITKSVQISYVGDTSKINNFQWDFDGGTVLSGSNNGPLKIKWNILGDKNIRLILINKSGANDTLTTKISVFPGISATLGKDTTISNGESIKLHPYVQGGTMPLTYFWNGNQGDSTKTFLIKCDSSIFFKVQDKNNCRAQSSITVNVPINEFSEPICLVTVDKNTGRNIVVWEKTSGKNIKEYHILKETTYGGDYAEIGNSFFLRPKFIY